METNLPNPICQGRTVNLPEGKADKSSPLLQGVFQLVHVDVTQPRKILAISGDRLKDGIEKNGTHT